MSLDRKLLTQAKSVLAEKRKIRDRSYDLRLEKVYSAAPRVRALDNDIMGTMADLFSVALTPGGECRVEEIRLKNLELQENRRSELLRAGFRETYLDDEYMCPQCRDSGYSGTKLCDCLLMLYKEEQRKSLSSLFKLGNETFDNFDLSYYDDTPAQGADISPRRTMEIIYETCIEYARKFGRNSMNLFFNGAPGLGKTFLSACIARVVAENGNSVVYDTAVSVFEKFGQVKFSRSDGLDEARSEVKRCLECDLLILDDLGTEMTTAFTVEALYEIINTRLVTCRKTIVSSNLTPQELGRRYSEQIMSRLAGEYHVLTFRGDDIRRKKNLL